MDKLTLIALATHQPRRACRYTSADESVMDTECAECALRMNLDFGEGDPELEQSHFACSSLCPRDGYQKPICAICKEPVEFE